MSDKDILKEIPPEIMAEAIPIAHALALENAIKFGGKANPGAVIGPLIAKFPELKENMKVVSSLAQASTIEINSKSLEEQKTEFEKLGSVKEEKEERVKTLKELPNVNPEKRVVMRFAPSPSGPMHLGHIITGMSTSLYTDRYKGKFILRIEDTNSDNIYPPAYELLPKDADWIFGNVSEVLIQSERLEIYYSYVEKFLDKNAVYVCTCESEKFREYSLSQKECPCRNLSNDEQRTRWKNMFDKNVYSQGDAVVRFKASMTDKNPALRDFPLARINDSEHPRQGLKYRVWPLMNLSVTVDDIESGMTHIIRAKDHQDNAKKQKMMFDVLEKPFPETLFSGRINFIGLELSCSKTKEKIEEGVFTGWDDIRLPFVGALRRRGYQAQAFKNYVNELGVNQVDKTVEGDEFFKTINAYNKDIIEPIAHRFFFVNNPVNIQIENAPIKEVELDLHPDNHKGGRVLKTQENILITKEDFDNIKEDEEYRLRDFYNFRKVNGVFVVTTETHDEFKGRQIIHWLPENDNLIETEVVMPNNSVIKGFSEKTIKILKEGDVVQLERFGFCRLDEIKDNKYIFWFTHK